RVEATLRVDIEATYGIDFVVEEVDAVGQYRAHGKEVDQASTDTEFARSRDLCHMGVVGQRELLAQCLFVQLLALTERKGIGRQEFRRRQAIQRCRDGHEQYVDIILHKGMQRAQTLRHKVLVR